MTDDHDALTAELAEARALYVGAQEDLNEAVGSVVALHAELAHIRDATKVGSMSWNFDQLGVAYEQLEARLADQMADRADLESVIEVQTGRLCTALAERDAARAELAEARALYVEAEEDIHAVVGRVVALRADRDTAQEYALQCVAERDAALAELAHIRDATKVGSMSWNFDQLGVAYEQLEARLAAVIALCDQWDALPEFLQQQIRRTWTTEVRAAIEGNKK